MKHTRFATLPPLTMMPPESLGNPISSATHRTVCRSISVATGDNAHAPQFALSDAASMSASAPIGDADDVM
jgi:hypothetical protein